MPEELADFLDVLIESAHFVLAATVMRRHAKHGKVAED